MKETLTLLERCQRQAREMVNEKLLPLYLRSRLHELSDTLIANTLKQAAEAILKERDLYPDISGNEKPRFYLTQAAEIVYTLTDAQRLLGEHVKDM